MSDVPLPSPSPGSRPTNSTPGCVPRRNENVHPHENLCMNVHSGTSHHSHKVKQPRCASAGEWINGRC